MNMQKKNLKKNLSTILIRNFRKELYFCPS